MLRRLNSFCLGLIAVALIPFAALAAQEEPTDVVRQYYDVLHDAMTNAQELGFEGRFELLRPAVEKTFDMPFIASFTVGRYWNNLDEQERAQLVEAVTRLSAATYAARFDDYSGEQFEVLEARETSRGDLLVLTRIIDSKDKPVEINYVMRRQDGEWRIVDVYLKGTYSELATRRSEFTSVIRREGYDALISTIDRKVAQLAEDS